MTRRTIVRRADALDLSTVASLNVEAYRELAVEIGPRNWRAMEANLRNVEGRAAESELLVAEVDEKVVGAVVYYPPRGERSFSVASMIPSDAAYLGVIAVAPSHRRRGIARRLTLACIDRAARDACSEIWLVTSELMPAARALYEGLGFVRRAETLRYDHRYWSYSRQVIGGSP